jgi:hypothetical protein
MIGRIEYIGKEYTFKFDGNELIIYGDIAKYNKILSESLKELSGCLYEDKYTWITFYNLYPVSINLAGTARTIYKVSGYFKSIEKDVEISKLLFSSDEINAICGLNRAYTYNHNENGVNLNIRSSRQVISSYAIKVKEDEFNLKWVMKSIVKLDSYKPLEINGVIDVEFKESKSGNNLWKYYYNVKSLLMFLCYRRNVDFTKCIAQSQNLDDLYYDVGEVYFRKDEEKYLEDKQLVSRVFIPIDIIDNNLVEIMKTLIENNLYLEHIPFNSRAKKSKTPARIVMIISAFERMFDMVYGQNVIHNDEDYLVIKDSILSSIDKIINESSGKRKRHAKSFYKKLIMIRLILKER